MPMFEQSSPTAQQRPDEELSSDTQFLSEGQLKLLGSFGSTAEHESPACACCLRSRSGEGSLGGSLEAAASAEDRKRKVVRTSKRRIVQMLDRRCCIFRKTEGGCEGRLIAV